MTFKTTKGWVLDRHAIRLWDTVAINCISTTAWPYSSVDRIESPRRFVTTTHTLVSLIAQPPGFHLQALWVATHSKQVASVWVERLITLQRSADVFYSPSLQDRKNLKIWSRRISPHTAGIFNALENGKFINAQGAFIIWVLIEKLCNNTPVIYVEKRNSYCLFESGSC